VPAFGQMMASPPQVRSGIKLTPYVDPLAIPPLIQAKGGPNEVIDIEMRQFQQKVHRDLPPGPTIEVQSGQALKINWTSKLR
jgi:spore coat protein A